MRDLAVLGINAAYHETAAALVVGGEVVFAVEEERISRRKHGKRALASNPDELPWRAIAAALAAGGVAPGDLDAAAYSLVPGLRRETLGRDPYVDGADGFGTEEGEREHEARVRGVPDLLARRLEAPGLAGRVRFVPHHLAHAASAFYPSPFEDAAVLVVDGIGERSTAWLGRGAGARLEALEEVPYPASLGLLWERVAVWLGFDEHDAAKVMGLAAYGDPGRFEAELARLVPVPDDDGGAPGSSAPPFLVDPRHARLRAGDVAGLEALLGPRRGDEPPDAGRFADAAAALQRRTEVALLATCRRLARATGARALAYAGGVALNCVANAFLEREGPFEALYVAPAAHDAGTALGAALEVALRLAEARGDRPARPRARPVAPFLGPEHDAAAVDAALARAGLAAERVERPAEAAAEALARGRVVGWFQGRLELGPRALGHRSLLADPRRPEARAALNAHMKHREPWRPFGAAILAEAADAWLELPARRPGAAAARDLMLLAYRVRPSRAPAVPAVVHRDGTCRVQVVERERQPALHALLARFEALTGVPLVLNTSFNDREPIVCSPDDALACFLRAGADELFLGDRRVSRP
ncbi:MAG: carbamoyltransferase [Planctomycetes bacterium]|nr:carbamoyltransferase [Planctomycetota bacterium]